MRVEELDTPALTIDLDILSRNIHDLAESCRRHEIALRVHTKTHKIPEIAHLQLEAGAAGIVCQKLGEAEAMADAGIADILIPYNIVGARKVERLVRLRKRATISVALDSETTARGISEKAGNPDIPVLIELDTGGSRCGVQSPEAALELARKVVRMPGLHFRGIMTYPSRTDAEPFLTRTRALLEDAGIPVPVVSGGGTGSEAVSKQIGCTETRIGSYVFEGMRRINHTDNPPNPVTCAERMIVTVVSTPTPDRIIVDGGQKTFASYPPIPYGYIVEHPDARIYGMSVEHGHIDVSACEHVFHVGERLSIIPQHQGMTTNLHDTAYAVRNGIVEAVWAVAGRGRVQ
ncbi:MAG: alanine racemase [Gemmatimonadota bacterium]|nr:alanine racemase [Gemmatimonadota bacterium]